jgi:acetyl esterase/lipase
MDKKSPYDPELRPVLEKMISLGIVTAYTLETLPAVRQARMAMRLTDEQLRRDGKIDFEERKVPGPEGAPEISLLVCRPNLSTMNQSNALLPCIYFIHGGGMIAGDNRFTLQYVLDWVVQLNIIVVSVEYRLAPEHPLSSSCERLLRGISMDCCTCARLRY